jgi:hypothetical protein
MSAKIGNKPSASASHHTRKTSRAVSITLQEQKFFASFFQERSLLLF